MYDLFDMILEMSLTASYVIVGVVIIRFLLMKSPKIIAYILWSVVAFRLVMPFSFESTVSLLPKEINSNSVTNSIIVQEIPQIDNGLNTNSLTNEPLNVVDSELVSNVNKAKVFEFIAVSIWIVGIILLISYYFYSVYKLKGQLKNATLFEDNVYEADNLKTPFVLGFLEPKIYLPSTIKEEERKYIVLHEQVHINRKDYLVKIFGFILLAIYWFNPLVWLAYILMNRDMEFSCDERVLKELSGDIRKSYATSLVSLATEKHIVNRIAFGEGDVKGRVKNVLSYKKSSFWVIGSSLLVAVVLGLGLMSNPVSGSEEEELNTTENESTKTDNANDEVEENLNQSEETSTLNSSHNLVGESRSENGLFWLGMSSDEVFDVITNSAGKLIVNTREDGVYDEKMLRLLDELENYDEIMYEYTLSDGLHLYFDKDKILKNVYIQQTSKASTYDEVIKYSEEHSDNIFYNGELSTEKGLNLLSTKDDLIELYGQPDYFFEKPYGNIYSYKLGDELYLTVIIVGEGINYDTAPFVHRITYSITEPVNTEPQIVK